MACIDIKGVLKAEHCRAVMDKTAQFIDAMPEYTAAEKATGLAHLVIAHMAIMGLTGNDIREMMDCIIEANPAISMEAQAKHQPGRA